MYLGGGYIFRLCKLRHVNLMNMEARHIIMIMYITKEIYIRKIDHHNMEKLTKMSPFVTFICIEKHIKCWSMRSEC